MPSADPFREPSGTRPAPCCPGVNVEARSPEMAGSQTTVTDADGAYRFPALPPGRFEVTATLQGFSPSKSTNIRIELGQVLKVDLVLSVGSVSESVQVRGEAPLIDVTQNAAGANVDGRDHRTHPEGARLRQRRDLGAGHHRTRRATAAFRSTARAAPTIAS